MENKLEKRYGLFMAVCMVIGIVIGSGVFFKAQDILNYTEGNMPMGIIAWLIGGAIMVICALTFSNLASQYEKVNGIVDYAEVSVGEKYAYYVGWFMTTLYYPGMTSVLAWVSARYTLTLFGSSDSSGGLCMTLSGFYLCMAYAVNSVSPKIAGHLQVSTTVIKLVPIAVMALVGTVAGIINGNMADAFGTWESAGSGSGTSGIFAAVVASAFAYEGWIIATSINAELKNAKRNLPLALTGGALIIILAYILYYIGWEFLFRGLGLFSLTKGGINPLSAILITTLISALIHTSIAGFGKPMIETLSAIFAGGIFGYITYKTKSIYYSLYMHALVGIFTDVFIYLLC